MNNKAINEFGFRRIWRISRYRRVLSTEAEELLIKVNFRMDKAFVKISVTILYTAVLGVLGLLYSKHDAIAPKKKTPCTRIANIYKFCIFGLTSNATLVCYLICLTNFILMQGRITYSQQEIDLVIFKESLYLDWFRYRSVPPIKCFEWKDSSKHLLTSRVVDKKSCCN